jgi:hypothetical protein
MDNDPNGYSRLPLKDALDSYINDRTPVGHFLTAVITNNLKEACGRADIPNRDLLWLYVQYLFNKAPGGCWGSVEAMNRWLAGWES